MKNLLYFNDCNLHHIDYIDRYIFNGINLFHAKICIVMIRITDMYEVISCCNSRNWHRINCIDRYIFNCSNLFQDVTQHHTDPNLKYINHYHH